MAELLLESEKVNRETFKTKTSFIVLEQSLRYIESCYISNLEEYFEFVLPAAWINLLILDALSL
jgi:hypothetical protein